MPLIHIALRQYASIGLILAIDLVVLLDLIKDIEKKSLGNVFSFWLRNVHFHLAKPFAKQENISLFLPGPFYK